ncbi:hypothetical protein E8E78_11905 [Pseudomonas sp. BN505]|uniref:hypothetical protein n=1 Tax=unclassified Pseudomonas TaxID=196821 RepID=UPI0024578BA2|nr:MULTISPECIES: hypothetical protein [unclassified Pseudomonas]MDH4844991.1 hypothetical protein [Pseudomonas sp. BN605]MDH4845096.1 hypothetical protein [Pseudomonas sp. BN605]MDH4846375.1 hypothetical protein [Pseudomonas sp. BN605]MDH4857293.1 hypothetical protein [Pseudomonas sp. BN505]MEB3438724.1 hypothetical protein [Pseudomonas sp. A2]
MKYEPTQPGNPHRFTINQHVFPKASIQRFAGMDGSVEVFSIPHQKVMRLKPNNPIFCAQRVWDQRTEAVIGKQIEDRFQTLADAIEWGRVTKIGIWEKRVVEEFFSLWRTRQRFRNEGLDDVTLNGVTSETLTKAEQEVLESKHTLYASDGVMKGRFLAGIHVIGYQDNFIQANESMQWGIVRSPVHHFLVPDSFEDMMIVPVSPRVAIVADMPDCVLTDDEVAVINQTAITRSTNFYFARQLAKASIIRRSVVSPFGNILRRP